MASRELTRDEARTAVKRGARLVKYGRRGAPHEVFARVDGFSVRWIGRRQRERSIDLRRVTRVVAGRYTESFRRYDGAHEDETSFSLVYEDAEGGTSRTWDVVCESQTQRDVWVFALQDLAREALQRGVAEERAAANGEMQSSTSGEELKRRDAFGRSATFGRSSKSLGRKMSLREREGVGVGQDVGDVCDALGSDVPNEVLVWGWRADVTPEDKVESTSGGFAVSTERWIRVDVPSTLKGMETLDVVELALGARHALARTRTGAVYSWGDGKGGKLGTPSGQDAELPVRIDTSGHALSIACGNAHSIAVIREGGVSSDDGGDVYTWGDPNAAPGLLGLPDTRSVMSYPGKISFESGMIALAQHRGASTLGVGVKVVQVSCGPCHTACVSETGACFTWGEGSFYALGHGDRESQRAPRQLETFKRDKRVVLRVSCGVWHTAAIVAAPTNNVARVTAENDEFDEMDGELFTWGDGETGQLGIRDVNHASVPTRTSNQLGEPGSEVSVISCGQHHTLALTSQGDLWLAGCVGKVDNSLRVTSFTRLTDFETGSVRAVASGDNHVVAMTRDGRVYSWGVGKNGRLGLGRNDRDQSTPQEIEGLRGRAIVQIACGPTSSACVLKGVRMTMREHASMMRLSTFNVRAASMKVDATTKVIDRTVSSSNLDTGSTSSHSTAKKDQRSWTTGSRNGGKRSSQGLKNEKAAHRLMSVLSPTYENVAKTKSRVEVAFKDAPAKEIESSPAAEHEADLWNQTDANVEPTVLDFAQDTLANDLSTSSPIENYQKSTVHSIEELTAQADVESTSLPELESEAVEKRNIDDLTVSQLTPIVTNIDDLEHNSMQILTLTEPTVPAQPMAHSEEEFATDECEFTERSVLKSEEFHKRTEQEVDASQLTPSTVRTDDRHRHLVEPFSTHNEFTASTQPLFASNQENAMKGNLGHSSRRAASEAEAALRHLADARALLRRTALPLETDYPSDVRQRASSKSSALKLLARPTTQVDEDISTTESFIERARRAANEAEATLMRLADEKNVLERANKSALTTQAKSLSISSPLAHRRPESHFSSGDSVPRDYIEEVEKGVFLTLQSLGDRTVLRRVRFSKRIFSERLAHQWWEENRDRIVRDLDLIIPL